MQVLNCNRQWKNISLRDLFALFYLEDLMGRAVKKVGPHEAVGNKEDG